MWCKTLIDEYDTVRGKVPSAHPDLPIIGLTNINACPIALDWDRFAVLALPSLTKFSGCPQFVASRTYQVRGISVQFVDVVFDVDVSQLVFPDANLKSFHRRLHVYRWVHIQTTFHPPEKETFGGLRNLDGGEAAAHCCMSHSRGLKLTPSADFLRSLGLAGFPKSSAVWRCADEMLRGGSRARLFDGWPHWENTRTGLATPELREGWLRRDVVRAASKRNTLTANED